MMAFGWAAPEPHFVSYFFLSSFLKPLRKKDTKCGSQTPQNAIIPADPPG
jgi:hypothetical protein